LVFLVNVVTGCGCAAATSSPFRPRASGLPEYDLRCKLQAQLKVRCQMFAAFRRAGPEEKQPFRSGLPEYDLRCKLTVIFSQMVAAFRRAGPEKQPFRSAVIDHPGSYRLRHRHKLSRLDPQVVRRSWRGRARRHAWWAVPGCCHGRTICPP